MNNNLKERRENRVVRGDSGRLAVANPDGGSGMAGLIVPPGGGDHVGSRTSRSSNTPSHNKSFFQTEVNTVKDALTAIFWSPISLLLICVPFGILSDILDWGDQATLWLNFVAMIPLAKILGDFTEELATCMKNDYLVGLLNATFGNAVEMIMTIFLLKQHQYQVVKYSLIGSMISNLLLVLGSSFLVGGIWGRLTAPPRESLAAEGSGHGANPEGGSRGGGRPSNTNMNSAMQGSAMGRNSNPGLGNDGRYGRHQQEYNGLAAMTNATMLFLACLVLDIVTVFSESGEDEQPSLKNDMMSISRVSSVLILTSYAAYFIFQLITHADAMADGGDDDGEDASPLGVEGSIAGVAISAAVISVCSEFLTEALEGGLEESGIGKPFMGVILVPIVGNACEHMSALRFAMQDKIGLSVGIAIGSSVQMALFVAPASVLLGWVMGAGPGGANMDLDFGVVNAVMLTLSVVLIIAMVADAKSNWFEGYLLIIAYAIIAVMYFYQPNDEEDGSISTLTSTAGPISSLTSTAASITTTSTAAITTLTSTAAAITTTGASLFQV